MNRLVRLAFTFCGLIVLLGWLSQKLGQVDLGGQWPNAIGLPIFLLAVGMLFVFGLAARIMGAGGHADPEQRRREARLRTTFRRPVEIDPVDSDRLASNYSDDSEELQEGT